MAKGINPKPSRMTWDATASEINQRYIAAIATAAVITGVTASVLDVATVVEFVKHAGEIFKDARAALQIAPVGSPAALSTVVAAGYITELRRLLKSDGPA